MSERVASAIQRARVFAAPSAESLEADINTWLEAERPKLRRTQLSVCTWRREGMVACFRFSALVTYEPADAGAP